MASSSYGEEAAEYYRENKPLVEPMKEVDERLSLMKSFVELSNKLDNLNRNARNIEEELDAVRKHREEVRRELDHIINPSQMADTPKRPYEGH